MIKYIFNTYGHYVAYIYNNAYCFSPRNEYIGFLVGIYLYDYKGKYIGYLTSDDRIIKNINEKKPNIVPITKPVKPVLPLKPFNRYRMSALGKGFIDVFLKENSNVNFDLYDEKFNKYLNSQLFASDGKYLGNINLNKYDSNSLANKYGNYGSLYSADSIFNKYGNYGSQYSNLSPFNRYSNKPLIIKINNKQIGKISDNKYLGLDIINATEFFNWFKDKIE